MPIPKTRPELRESVCSTFRKLSDDLDAAGPRAGNLPCVDDWSIKDLLAVRVWWTTSVIDWIEDGRRGDTPVIPAEGFRWSETPRLNANIVKKSRRDSYRAIRAKLQRAFERVIQTIDALDDRELLDAGAYEWAGKYPLSRWISINTTRQYTTARSFVRRALKNQ